MTKMVVAATHKEEPLIKWHLREDGNEVVLVGTDNFGKSKDVCAITSEGKLFRIPNAELSGLDTGTGGKIIVCSIKHFF